MTRRPRARLRGRLQRLRALAPCPEHGLDHAVALVRPGLADDAHARTLRALAEENALLARELGRVQARCTRWRADCIAQVERLEASLMRARADAIIKQTRIAALEDALRNTAAHGAQDDLRASQPPRT
jgi:hypothetical protein